MILLESEPQRNEAALEASKLLVFMAQDLRFAVGLEAVERVLNLMALQPVPQGPDYLLGLMNLRGRNVPVLDLTARLGLERSTPFTLRTPVILVVSGSRRAGLVADRVISVETVTEEALQMQAEFEGGTPLFRGVVEWAGGQALLLDLERLLRVDFGSPEPGPAEEEGDRPRHESACR